MIVNKLRDSLDALVAWSEKWQLTIFRYKSAISSIGQPTCMYIQAYRIKDTNFSNLLNIQDLGITIDDKLTLSQHVGNVII